MKNQNKEYKIKTALYRSMHRGCKETDILLGVYATQKIAEFNDAELDIYSDLVLEDDVFIYDWILQKVLTPKKYESLILDIRKFHDL